MPGAEEKSHVAKKATVAELISDTRAFELLRYKQKLQEACVSWRISWRVSLHVSYVTYELRLLLSSSLHPPLAFANSWASLPPRTATWPPI